uniref:Mis18 domain-containing protein n=1 Tax=Gopherus evgoodei TaxID=1825980 RepID=A0A8C4VCA1_9SAUR
MAGAQYVPAGAGLDASLSLLEAESSPGAAAAAGPEEQEELPMVFLCAGCKRPVGDTLGWVANDEETGCVLLRSECPGACRAPAPPPPRRCASPFPPRPLVTVGPRLSVAGASPNVSVEKEQKLSSRPGECGW